MIRKLPYIKPTRRIHDSGFRCFEVGYIIQEDGEERPEILGNGTDHVHTDFMALIEGPRFGINIDLDRKGYIRFFSHEGDLVWNSSIGLSSMGLKLIPRQKEKKHG